MAFDVRARTTCGPGAGGGGSGAAGPDPGKRTLLDALPRETVFRSAKPRAAADGAGHASAAFDAATSGAPTELPYRSEMERAFGQDFGGVQAFVGGGARAGLDAIGADAAARGDAVAFGASPDRRLVAHELTHVVQQRQGGPIATQGKSGLSDPSDAAEREADAVADRVAAGERVTVGGTAGAVIHRSPKQDDKKDLSRAEEKNLSKTSPGVIAGHDDPAGLTLSNFAIEGAALKPEHQVILAELAHALKRVPPGWLRVAVTGHTDDSGEPDVNNPLSKQRALAVQAALAKSGAPTTIAWRGEDAPVAGNDSVDGRSQNRRVELELWLLRALPGARAAQTKQGTGGTSSTPPPPKPQPPQPQPPQPPPPTGGHRDPDQPPPKKPDAPKAPDRTPPGDRTRPTGKDQGGEATFCDEHPALCKAVPVLVTIGGGAVGVATTIGGGAATVGGGLWTVVVTGTGIVGTIVDHLPSLPSWPDFGGGDGGGDGGDRDHDHDKDKDKDQNDPVIVKFDPVRSANTPAKMNDRITPGKPTPVGVHVTGWKNTMPPIRISVVSPEGGGGALIDGAQAVDITGSTTIHVSGHNQTAEGDEQPHLEAMLRATSVGTSNHFAISAIPEAVTATWLGKHEGDHGGREVLGYKVDIDWTSDTGRTADLDGVTTGEQVERVEVSGSLKPFDGAQSSRPQRATKKWHDIHALFSDTIHGAGHSVTNQIWFFSDARSDSPFVAIKNSGYELRSEITEDGDWCKIEQTQIGKAVSANSYSAQAGKAVPGKITNDERINCHKTTPPPKATDKPGGKDKDKDPTTQSTKGKAKPKSFRHVTPRGVPDSKLQTTEHTTLAGDDLIYLHGLPADPKVGQEVRAAFAYQSPVSGEWLYADLNVQVTGFDDPANLADGQGEVFVKVVMVQYLDARVFDMDPLSNSATRLFLLEGTALVVDVASLKPS